MTGSVQAQDPHERSDSTVTLPSPSVNDDGLKEKNMNEKKDSRDWFELGMVEFASARYDKSIDLFTRAIDSDGNNLIAFVSRGAAYLQLDHLDQARDDFDSAVVINPEYARAFHMRGLVNEKRGDDRSALADFDRAIELNPTYGAAYYSRAAVHSKMNNDELAQYDIQMVAQVSSHNIENFMNENNVWQTQHMRVEDYLETELER
jgi:tetratricopeptide (TPR) repeat protein